MCKEKISPKERVIGFEIKGINNMIRRRIDTLFTNEGLTEFLGMQGPILSFIRHKSEEGDVFQRDIEKEFSIRRSTATVTLQNLEQKGLIIRIPVEEDGRLKKICVTPKANQYGQRVEHIVDLFHEKMEEGITEEERQELFRILDKIKNNLRDSD